MRRCLNHVSVKSSAVLWVLAIQCEPTRTPPPCNSSNELDEALCRLLENGESGKALAKNGRVKHD